MKIFQVYFSLLAPIDNFLYNILTFNASRHIILDSRFFPLKIPLNSPQYGNYLQTQFSSQKKESLSVAGNWARVSSSRCDSIPSPEKKKLAACWKFRLQSEPNNRQNPVTKPGMQLIKMYKARFCV